MTLRKDDPLSKEWKYKVIRGELKIGDKTFPEPPSYIAALNDFANRKLIDDTAYKYFNEIAKAKMRFIQEKYEKIEGDDTLTADEKTKQKDAEFLNYYEGKLDFSATNSTTNVSVTQLAGRRYEDQQDSFTTGKASVISALGDTYKKQALLSTMQTLHQEIVKENAEIAKTSGSTACVVVIDKNKVFTASVGDSVAYLCKVDAKGIVHLTRLNKKLHDAKDPEEIKRIEKFLQAQGRDKAEISNILSGMKKSGRIGGLALTGAIGDTDWNELGILHAPEKIDEHEITLNEGEKAFVIVACDGLTERMQHEQIKQSIQNGAHGTAEEITQILSKAAFDSGSTDNITIIAKEIVMKNHMNIDPEPIYFGVFDGHGGNKVSYDCTQRFDSVLQNEVNKLLLLQQQHREIVTQLKNVVHDQTNLIEWQHDFRKPINFFGLGSIDIKANNNESKRYFLPPGITNIIKILSSETKRPPIEILHEIKKKGRERKNYD